MTEERDIKQDHVTEVWRYLFIGLITLTAAIMAWGVHQVTGGIEIVSSKQDSFLLNFQTYVISMEHRVTILENYQHVQDEEQQKDRRRLDEMMRRDKK